jgi:hypothetical protein
LGGCYVYTFSPLPSGSSVALKIKTNEADIEMAGRVVAFHPGVGMGIEFQGGSGEGNLKTLIGTLENSERSTGAAST